ncbi:MAG: nucleoside-diphosphate sugar epimerase/dehydratase [Paracoccaceae bacterium]
MTSGLALDTFLSSLAIMPALLLSSLIYSYWLGVASIQLKDYEASAIGDTAIFSILVALTGFLLCRFVGIPVPDTVYVVFGIYFFVFSVISRAVLLQIVLAVYRLGTNRCRVLIYGAGTTGVQLVLALRTHEVIDPVAFVDDNISLQGQQVARLPVYSPRHIDKLVKNHNIDRVLLAMPSQTQPKQAQIARSLQEMGLEVQTLPSFSQLIGEEALVDKLKPVQPNRFLNRDEVRNTLGDATHAYADKNVLISGAGGSIGSELCRQIIGCRPSRLVLFEMSEIGLYQIHRELSDLAKGSGVEIVPILGTVTNRIQVAKVLAENEIQVILHAAAYKHVPLVEMNPLPGLYNNVIGTQTLALEAASAGVERFLLVSSDKAVRPTNIMGASKRLAELVLQDLASRIPDNGIPKFAVVRFGNVLGSSGSVVPLFQDQISHGGPVTVTHPDVARYFMTDQEAVNLVLQVGAIADGGEVYVLDMGKPVLIQNLARQIIESAGYSVMDDRNPDGDIEIKFIGLRPGEKMREELSVTGTLVGTNHKKIFQAIEESLSEIEVAKVVHGLRDAIQEQDEDAARAIADRWVEPWDPNKDANVADQTTAERLIPVS